LPHGASRTWPRDRGGEGGVSCWGGGPSCCGGGPSCCGGGPSCCGWGPSCCGAGASCCGGGAAGCCGAGNGCSARGGGAATGGATGFTVGAGTCGGSGVIISPTGAGLISSVSTAPFAVPGSGAAPTTHEAVLIKAAITAHRACNRRLHIAMVFDAITRQHGRRAAAPDLRVCAKAQWCFTVTTSYDIHHCRRHTVALLPLGVD
jgi:hypothetical protein